MSPPRLPRLVASFCVLCALCGALARANDKPPRFHLPPGFVIEQVAGPPLVEHPMFACFDERGRLFIAASAGKNLKADELIKQKPNFIRVLEPADESGKFTKGHVFADKMTFPMGVCWYDGALYTCSSGALWKLEDTKNKGVADKRTELVKKFGFTGNAADVHGPYLSPDGRLYWCEGRHGHEIKAPDGKGLKARPLASSAASRMAARWRWFAAGAWITRSPSRSRRRASRWSRSTSCTTSRPATTPSSTPSRGASGRGTRCTRSFRERASCCRPPPTWAGSPPPASCATAARLLARVVRANRIATTSSPPSSIAAASSATSSSATAPASRSRARTSSPRPTRTSTPPMCSKTPTAACW